MWSFLFRPEFDPTPSPLPPPPPPPQPPTPAHSTIRLTAQINQMCRNEWKNANRIFIFDKMFIKHQLAHMTCMTISVNDRFGRYNTNNNSLCFVVVLIFVQASNSLGECGQLSMHRNKCSNIRRAIFRLSTRCDLWPPSCLSSDECNTSSINCRTASPLITPKMIVHSSKND